MASFAGSGSSAAPCAMALVAWRTSSSFICSTIARLRLSSAGSPLEVALQMRNHLPLRLCEEAQVSAVLQAAQILSKQAEAMQLRYLQTLTNIAGDKASTIVFPVPMDLITPMLEALKKRGA